MSQGNLSKAFQYLTKSSEIFKYDYKVYKNLIKVMLRANQYNAAIQRIKYSKKVSHYIERVA